MDLIEDIDASEDLQPTQPIDDRVLKDVIAYVEVRSANDNRSSAIRKELEQLGAVVVDKFTDIVTHVIFKEGSKRTKNKAKKMGIQLVSVLWVDSCKHNQEHVSEKLFPANVPNEKGTPTFVRAKLKKAKSMQPVDFNDDVANSAERCTKRKMKRLELIDKLKSNDSTPVTSPLISKILVLETQPRSPLGDLDTPIRLTIPDTPASMKAKMKELQDAKLNGSILGHGSGSNTPVLPGCEENIQKNLFGCFINGGISASEENNFDHEDKENPIPSPLQKRSVSLPVETSSNTGEKKSKRSDRRKTIATITLPTNEEDNNSVEKLKLPADGKANARKTSNRRKSMSASVSFADDILNKEVTKNTEVETGKKQVTLANEVLKKKNNYTESKQETKKKTTTSTVTFAEDLHIEEKQTKTKKQTRRKSLAVIPQSGGLNESLLDSELPKIVSKRRGRRSMGNVLPGDLEQVDNFHSTSLIESLKINENSEEEFLSARNATDKCKKSSRLAMDNVTTKVTSDSSESSLSKATDSCAQLQDTPLPENKVNLENHVEKSAAKKIRRRSMVLRNETSDTGHSENLHNELVIPAHIDENEKNEMSKNPSSSEINKVLQDSNHVNQLRCNGISKLNECNEKAEPYISDKGRRKSITKRKSSVNNDKSESQKDDKALSANYETSNVNCYPHSEKSTEVVKNTATLKKRNSKKKLLTVNDCDPNSFLIEPTVCSDKVRPALLEEKTGKRKRKLKNSSGAENEQPASKQRNGENLTVEMNINNTCINKSQSRDCSLVTGLISAEKNGNRVGTEINSNINNVNIEYSAAVDTESSAVLTDISLTAMSNDNNNDMSMSVAFDDNTLPSILGRLPPRPSINEFNLKKIAPRIKGRQRLHHSDSSVLGKENSDGAFKSSDSTCTSDSDSGPPYKKKIKKKSDDSTTAVKRSPHRPSLVMTSLHTCEQDVVISVLRKLGGFVITDNVTDITSHVICGGPRRTLNVLHAMALGCWLVKKEWIMKSLEAGHWLPEEEFEASDWFPAAKTAREEQEHCKEHKYRSELLSSCGFIFVCPKTLPPRNDLISLIKRCNGKVTNSISKAEIFIGNDFYPDKTCVKPLWLLDCITQHELLSTETYCVGQAKRESSPEF